MLEPTLFSEPEASWPCVKGKEVNCSPQAAIWGPEAISEGCAYIWKYRLFRTMPHRPNTYCFHMGN